MATATILPFKPKVPYAAPLPMLREPGSQWLFKGKPVIVMTPNNRDQAERHIALQQVLVLEDHLIWGQRVITVGVAHLHPVEQR